MHTRQQHHSRIVSGNFKDIPYCEVIGTQSFTIGKALSRTGSHIMADAHTNFIYNDVACIN